jgi:hypothetical protein
LHQSLLLFYNGLQTSSSPLLFFSPSFLLECFVCSIVHSVSQTHVEPRHKRLLVVGLLIIVAQLDVSLLFFFLLWFIIM